MYTKILAPVDGSPFSEQALQEAIRLAKQGGELVILSVLLELPAGIPHIPKLEQHSEQGVEDYVMRLENDVRNAGVRVSHSVRWGQPASEIVKAASEVGADLIVMASHGVGAAGPGMPSYRLGGVTFKVLYETPCPVLVIPIRRGS
jgi:universal stress protein F